MQDAREINDIRSIIEQMNKDPGAVNELKKEIQDKGLDNKIKDFEKQYGGKVNEFMAELNKKGPMTDEEKARLVMNMKKSLPKDTQRQLTNVIKAMKNYLKNN